MIEQTLEAYASTGATAVVWILIGLSVLAVGVSLERLLSRWTNRTTPALLQTLEERPTRWAPAEVKQLLDGDGMEARVLQAGWSGGLESGVQGAEEALAAELVRMRLGLGQRLGILGTIGSNAPFIGLLGTVLGILRAFGDLSLDSNGGSELVMAGISEALVATAIGLAVAIPAVVLYNIFVQRNERVVERTVALGHQLVQQFHPRVS